MTTLADLTRPTGPWRDIVQGLAWRDLWLFLAWRRLRDSYRRTRLGPLWITIGVAVFIGGYSVIGAQLFSVHIKTFLPDLAVGFVLWQLVSGAIINSCGVFRSFASVRQSRAIPFTVFISANTVAEVIKFLHHLVIWPLVALFVAPFTPNIAAAVSLFVLVIVNLFLLGYVLAILCTRVGDLQHVVASGLQLIFFLTPVIWPIERLKGVDWVYLYNPIFYLIHPLKAAVLGLPIEPLHILGLVCLTALNLVLFVLTIRAYYFRIQFWL